MTVRIFALSLLYVSVLSGGVCYAQKSKGDRKVVQQLRTDIGYLASDALEGRRTGYAGEQKAGDYIIQRYNADSIKAYNGQYRYPFHFNYGKEIGKSTHVEIDHHVMRMNEDAFPLPFSASKHVQGTVLPDVNEPGNIWMMALYADSTDASNPHFDAEKSIYERTKEATKQGATAVIFYDALGSRWAPEFRKMSEFEPLDIPVVFLKNDAYKAYVSAAAAPATVVTETILTDSLVYDTTATSVGLDIDLDISISKADRMGTNIATYIDNKAPYTVIIGAHYDHLGRGEDGNSLYTGKDSAVHNGADDNASGTAAVLQLAEWAKHKKHLYHYNYLFINFSGEELGLLGSKAFVKDQHIDSAHIAYMINLDMVGRLNDSTHALTMGGIGTSPKWAEYMDEPDPHFKIVVDSSGIGPSDHSSFYHEGIPVLFFFTGTHRDYHKPSDDSDKINYLGELQVIKYVEYIVADMDKEHTKPMFTPTKQTTVGKVNFKVTLGIMPDYSFTDGGVRVDGVSDNRPAFKAGIKEGDIIIKLGDIKVQGMQSYMEALGKFEPGDKTHVTVIRAGKEMELPIEMNK